MTDPDFVNEMRELLGEECDALLSSYGQKAFSALRINRLKAGNKLPGFTDALRKVPWAKDAFYYDDLIELKGQGDEDIKSMAPGRHPFHEAGLYYIQEPSAMAPVTYLDVKRGERVLDLCAAPGGKSCQIADALNGKGILISNEINVSRAGILSENIERLGIGNALVLSESPDALAKRFPCFFDRVLVDAPCSGEGMMRKREEARKEWSLDNVRLCAKRQDDILREAAKMLRYGGRMVYSTCTFNKEENEGTIERFLDHHPDFCMENIPLYDGMTHGIKEVLKAEENACGMARIFPHRADGEGHFIAVLKKKDKPGIYTGSVPAGGFEQGIPVKDRKKMTELYDFLDNTVINNDVIYQEDKKIISFGNLVYAIPGECPSLRGLKVIRAGLQFGNVMKNRFEPSHALALSLKKEDVKAMIDLPPHQDEIYRYIRGETLNVDESLKGWVLVCCGGLSIGWGKAVNGVLKNHYPKGLRKDIGHFSMKSRM